MMPEADSIVGTLLHEPERFAALHRLIGPDVSRKIGRMIGLDTPRLAVRIYELSGIVRPRDVVHFSANFSPSRALIVSFGEHCDVVHVWRASDMSLHATQKLRARFAAFDDTGSRVVLATDAGVYVWPIAGDAVRHLKHGSAIRAIFAGANSVWMRLQNGSAKLVTDVESISPSVIAEVQHVADVRWHRAAKMALVLKQDRHALRSEGEILLYSEQGKALGVLCPARSLRCHLTEPLVYVDESTIYDVVKRAELVGGVKLVQSEHEYDPALSTGGYDLVAIGPRWVNMLRESFLKHYLSRVLPLDQALVLLMCQLMDDWRLAGGTPPSQVGAPPPRMQLQPVRHVAQFTFGDGVGTIPQEFDAQPTFCRSGWVVAEPTTGFVMPTEGETTTVPKERFRFSTAKLPHLRRVIEGMPEELQRWVISHIRGTHGELK
jgi:hypothetical protein